MIYKTHHIAGLIAAELVLIHFKQPLLSWEAAAALFAGYFAGPAADIDQPQSFIGQRVPLIPGALQNIGVRHRTFTHSLLMMYLLSLLTLPVPDVIKWSLLIGYASHPILDLFNVEGVELLWPIPWRFRISPVGITTDSVVETAFRTCLVIISVFFFVFLFQKSAQSIPVLGPLSRTVWTTFMNFLPQGAISVLNKILY